MRVLFDLNVVSHMHSLGKLDKLVSSKSHIIPHASFSFLEELAGLIQTEEKFSEILDWYRSHIWGRLIRPWTVLVREETEARKKAVASEDHLVVPHEVVLRVFNAMGSGNEFVDGLRQHVQSEKNEAKVRLNEMSDWMQRQFAGDHRTVSTAASATAIGTWVYRPLTVFRSTSAGLANSVERPAPL